MAKRVIAGTLAAFAIIAAIFWIPWATKERVVVTTPVPPPIFGITPAPVKPGGTACLQNVTFTPDTQVGEIGLTTGAKPGPSLAIAANAPGYHVKSRIAGGYHDDPAARFSIATPPGPVIGTICFKNTGRNSVSLNGTNEFRTMGRPTLTIDGVAEPYDAKLIFYAHIRSSYASRVGDIFTHAAIFTPAFFSKAVLIAIALLALLGIPLAIAFALARAERDDERAAD